MKIYTHAYLDCVVHGNPSPQLIWLKGGVQINSTQPRFSILDNGTLHISGVLVEDGGVYQCVVSNVGGSASKNTTLDVLCMFVTLSCVISEVHYVSLSFRSSSYHNRSR